MSLLQIYHRVCQQKSFENRLTFEVQCIVFLTHGVQLSNEMTKVSYNFMQQLINKTTLQGFTNPISAGYSTFLFSLSMLRAYSSSMRALQIQTHGLQHYPTSKDYRVQYTTLQIVISARVISTLTMYTVSHKKGRHQTCGSNFIKP